MRRDRQLIFECCDFLVILWSRCRPFSREEGNVYAVLKRANWALEGQCNVLFSFVGGERRRRFHYENSQSSIALVISLLNLRWDFDLGPLVFVDISRCIGRILPIRFMLHACSTYPNSGSWHGQFCLLYHLALSGVYIEVDMSSSLQPECRKNGRFLWSRAQSDRPWSGLQMTYRRDRWSIPCHSKQCCSWLVSTACF